MTSKTKEDVLEVYLDTAMTGGLAHVGLLINEGGHVRFKYAEEWIKRGDAFQIDPRLTLDKDPFHPDPKRSNFGIFLDSSPDRWGQRLMDRRERLMALEDKRAAKTLRAWDYLLGVQDLTRMGALRFKRPDAQIFLDDQPLAAPPVTHLGELAKIAGDIASNRFDPTRDQLRKWLSVLVAPGASLGGACPKANFRANDGSLWIAKFPSRDDLRDYAQWELLCHDLAVDAGIECPPAHLQRFNNAFHTLCIRRFDRDAGERFFFTSAMSALNRTDGDEGSYLDLLDHLQRSHRDRARLIADQEQLYRRTVFNAMVGNCDDHLRNHGFMIDAHGWRLAPAYDMNPSTDGEHVLDFDGSTKSPDLSELVESAQFYDLPRPRAEEIISKIGTVVARWQEEAVRRGINRDDIELTAPAFALADDTPKHGIRKPMITAPTVVIEPVHDELEQVQICSACHAEPCACEKGGGGGTTFVP